MRAPPQPGTEIALPVSAAPMAACVAADRARRRGERSHREP